MADIEEFKELLSKLRERMQRSQALYRTNEAAVRTQLIEPALGFFGWRVDDPLQVVPEYKTGDGAADYCLMLEAGKKRGLFVEAKNMSKSPKDGLRALMRYCTDMGVSYSVSTTGKKWLLFRTFEEGKKVKERIKWTIDLFENSVKEVFDRLWMLSPEALPDLEKKLTQVEIERLIDRCLQKPSSKIVSGMFNAVREEPEFSKLSCTNSELRTIVRGRLPSMFLSPESIQVVEKQPQHQPETKPARKRRPPQHPKAIVLFDKRNETKCTCEILPKVANELIRRKVLSAKNVPIKMDRAHSRFLVNTIPKHDNATRFERRKKLDGGLWIELHYRRELTERCAQTLLKHCGYKPSDLQIIWK